MPPKGSKKAESAGVDYSKPAHEWPTYNVARDLVRMLGNVCYQHRENQDQIRLAEVGRGRKEREAKEGGRMTAQTPCLAHPLRVPRSGYASPA